jgi:hypothetical protein
VARRGVKRGSAGLKPLSPHADAPPEIQRLAGKVMTGVWRDPADINIASRNAKEIRGWRQPCMLRWCRTRHKDRSPFTAEHVVAADELRRVYDLARLGATGKKNPWIYTDIYVQPKLGPTQSEMAGYRAWREMGRVRKRFTTADWYLLGWFVLENLSVGKWVEKEVAAGRRCDPKAVMQRIVGMMDVLVEHFGDVIRRADLSLAA